MRSDEELMKAYAEGDLASFEELYKRHKNKIYNFLSKRCSSKQMTDEVFQNTFLKLHELRMKYSNSEKFLPWLFLITRSVWIDRLRKDGSEKRKIEAFITDPAASVTEGKKEDKDQPSVNDLILKLPEKHREMLRMRYVESLGFDEIAQKTGTKAEAVRQSISRSIRKLKSIMKGEQP